MSKTEKDGWKVVLSVHRTDSVLLFLVWHMITWHFLCPVLWPPLTTSTCSCCWITPKPLINATALTNTSFAQGLLKCDEPVVKLLVLQLFSEFLLLELFLSVWLTLGDLGGGGGPYSDTNSLLNVYNIVQHSSLADNLAETNRWWHRVCSTRQVTVKHKSSIMHKNIFVNRLSAGSEDSCEMDKG